MSALMTTEKAAPGCRYALRSGRGTVVAETLTKDVSTKRLRVDRVSKKSKAAKREKSVNVVQSDASIQASAIEEDMCKKYLIKSEPTAFSIEDLEKEPNQTTYWDGVRNYQARNIMKEMHIGDLCFFYHSNSKPTAIVGIVRVTKEAYPDHTAWDKNSHSYDPTSTEENPKWFMIDVQLIRKLNHPIPLSQLKQFKEKELKQMPLLFNSRLSVQSVDHKHWDFVLSLEKQK